MNRRTRTLVVVAVAVVLASLASFGVYRAIRAIPVREVPIATNFAVVAADGNGHAVAGFRRRHTAIVGSAPADRLSFGQ